MTRKGQAKLNQAGGEERSVTPLYHQIYVVLRQKIRDGEFTPDAPLPGENQLAKEFGVSRVTIRKTLHNLEQDGFIVKHRGIGSFPMPQAAEFRDRYNIGGLLEPGSGPDDSTKLTTLSIELVEPPGHIRAKLTDASDTTSDTREQQVLRLIRMRSIRGEPFTVMTAYFAAEHAADLDHKTLKKMPPPAALEAIGISMERAEQWISARNADETTAPLLKVPIGSALIFMGTTFFDQQEQAVITLESLYRPDLYEYRSTMRRSDSGKWQPVI
jgi:GntR family transcriptional regulator